MKVEIKDDKLIITLPISKRTSKTGKSTIIAGTSGFLKSDAEFEGKPVSVSVNAIISKD